MKIAVMVPGVFLVLIGCVWILLGSNVLPGSFMTEQMQWAVFGVVAFVIGALLRSGGRWNASLPDADA